MLKTYSAFRNVVAPSAIAVYTSNLGQISSAGGIKRNIDSWIMIWIGVVLAYRLSVVLASRLRKDEDSDVGCGKIVVLRITEY